KRISIGRATITFFIIGATIISIANAGVLIKVANINLSWWCFYFAVFLALIISSLVAWRMELWAAREINRLMNKRKPD
ncbi:MAG TPA: hypothetical protein VGC89_01425, partial [Pyrinomonadaceae bacterium]